jgi:lipoate---protein ligase
VAAAAANPASRVQVYLSKSNNPFINLSIEHYLLQKTPPDSTILFLYTNRPCIVIGRNQNPWVEVNLPLLRKLELQAGRGEVRLDGLDPSIQLVRRRSGGGTVVHDEGNVNFSVICPPAAFDRDRHAEMVVRALKSVGVPSVSVNCRHDIVIDGGSPASSSSSKSACNLAAKETYKISGSAYKLTRFRSLHHGTCLLSSPNLGHFSSLLRSPAEPYIKARGVESVRSRVCNVGISNPTFEDAVLAEFQSMYGQFDINEVVGDNALEIPEIATGFKELEV